ncbi:UNVERIFIED_CONTAM: hypothetical protein FKN15_005914 [Acipenser sinensis]
MDVFVRSLLMLILLTECTGIAEMNIKKFSTESEDIIVVSCSVTGKPSPMLAWNTSENVTEHEMEIKEDDKGIVTIVSNVTVDLSTFQANEITCYAYLQNPTRSEERQEVEKTIIVRSIVEMNIEKFSTQSEDIIIVRCSAVGKPDPMVTWKTSENVIEHKQERKVDDNGIVTVIGNVTVDLSTFQANEITCIAVLGHEDEQTLEKSIHLREGSKIEMQSNGSTAILNEDFTLKCSLSNSNIMQVTWQKEKDKGVESVATYSQRFGPNVLAPFHERVNFSRLGLNESSITIHNVQTEDEGCYMCLFNAYPNGAITGKTCFTVFGIVEMNIKKFSTESEDIIVVSCSVTGKPSPMLAWNTSENVTEHEMEIKEDDKGIVTIPRHYKTAGSKIEMQSNGSTAILNEDFTLKCSLSNSNIMQVTWQKEKDKGVESVATYSQRFGPNVLAPFHERVNFSRLGLNESSITIHNVQTEDEGCYMCLFNAYPNGAITGKTCFTVFGKNIINIELVLIEQV